MAIAREAEPIGALREVREAGPRREDLLGIYRNMLITRGVEERGHILYRQGKIPGLFFTGPGHQAASPGAPTAATRRRPAAPQRGGRGKPPARRCTGTWACTSRAASSRGRSLRSTWGGRT